MLVYNRFLLLVSILLVCAATSITHAQINTSYIQTPLILSMSPQYPSAGETVDVTLTSYAVDLGKSYVEWYRGSTLIDSGIGKTSIAVKVGGVGNVTTISAFVRSGKNSPIFDEIEIRPTGVSLLWEADTYTPPFYRGRALMSPGADVKVEAYTNFISTGGHAIPPEELVYSWKRNGKILASQSGRGRMSIIIPGDELSGNMRVTVDVESSDASLKGSRSISIPSTDVYMALYEDDPILGVLYNKTIENGASIGVNDTVFAAIPYFTSAEGLKDTSLSYEWTVNGQMLETDPADPFRVSFVLPEDILIESLTTSLEIIRAGHLLQGAEKIWSLYTNEQIAPARDPFRGTVN